MYKITKVYWLIIAGQCHACKNVLDSFFSTDVSVTTKSDPIQSSSTADSVNGSTISETATVTEDLLVNKVSKMYK